MTAEEQVFTARETEMAERKKAIELIAAPGGRARGAAADERGAAEKDASADRGARSEPEAEADADADKIQLDGVPHSRRDRGRGRSR